MNANSTSFRINPRKVWKHFLGFIIVFSCFIIFILGIFSSRGSGILDFILFLFTIICLFYSLYILLFLITTRLILSDDGFYYHQPLYSIFCEWKYVGVNYLDNIIYFTIDQNYARVKFHKLEKIFINQQNMWLNYFVYRFDRYQLWTSDPVLVELQKHIPNLTDAVKKHFSVE